MTFNPPASCCGPIRDREYRHDRASRTIFIETGGQVVVEAEHYTSKTDGINHAYMFIASNSPMQIVATSNGAPWLYESMKTASQAITIPTFPTN